MENFLFSDCMVYMVFVPRLRTNVVGPKAQKKTEHELGIKR